ncbi:MAG: hypothetical protein AAFX01_10800 [Cyanobacteria bacterium J06638_28]
MPGANVITNLGAAVFDRLGDFNPQLLRELKGRLKWFPVLAAVGISVLVQFVMLIGFAVSLPGGVITDDMHLATYPQISWDRLSSLAMTVQQEALPAEAANREQVEISGVFISRLETLPTVRGNDAFGQAAVEQLQVGDRLIAINDIAIDERYPTDSTHEENFWAHLKQVNDLIKGTEHIYRMSPKDIALIDTRVNLTLYRPGREEFTVQVPRVAIAERNNRYCLNTQEDTVRYGKSCLLTPDKQAYQVAWPLWFGDIFNALTMTIVFPLMGVGVFLLANNLANEKQRGTLNFIRLSPRSALTVLGGKIMGVPICLYLAIALILPFHIAAGLGAGYGAGYLLGFYVALMAQTLVFYLVALLFSLSTSHHMLLALQPWLLAAGVIAFNWMFWLMTLASQFPEHTDSNPFMWFVLLSPFMSYAYFLPQTVLDLGTEVNMALGIFRINFVEYTILTVVHAIGWYAILGHAIQRRFNNATITLLKRGYSYLLTGLFMGIMLTLSHSSSRDFDAFEYVILIVLLSLLYFVPLAIALTSNRQTLQDWARFRHAQVARSQRLSLWKDLLVGDTSSPLVAIGLNLMIGAIAFAAWFLTYHHAELFDATEVLVFVSSVLLFVGSIFFSMLVSQILMLVRRKKNWFWFTSIGSASCLTFPGVSLLMAMLIFGQYPTPALVWGMPPELAIVAIPLSLLGTVTAILTFVHARQLMLVGRSESQQLLQGAVS